jgi:hypothetical protein
VAPEGIGAAVGMHSGMMGPPSGLTQNSQSDTMLHTPSPLYDPPLSRPTLLPSSQPPPSSYTGSPVFTGTLPHSGTRRPSDHPIRLPPMQFPPSALTAHPRELTSVSAGYGPVHSTSPRRSSHPSSLPPISALTGDRERHHLTRDR